MLPKISSTKNSEKSEICEFVKFLSTENVSNSRRQNERRGNSNMSMKSGYEAARNKRKCRFCLSPYDKSCDISLNHFGEPPSPLSFHLWCSLYAKIPKIYICPRLNLTKTNFGIFLIQENKSLRNMQFLRFSKIYSLNPILRMGILWWKIW